MQGRKPTLTPLVAPGSPGSPDLAASGKFRVGDFEIGRAGIRQNGSSSTSAEAPPPATAAAALDFGELRLLDVIGRGASGFVRRASHDPSGRVLVSSCSQSANKCICLLTKDNHFCHSKPCDG